MNFVQWYRNMRIGIKIISGAVLVGALFLGVVSLFWGTLGQVSDGYQRLLDKESQIVLHAMQIDSAMLLARRAEKDFLLRLDSKYVEKVNKEAETVAADGKDLVALERSIGNEAGAARGGKIVENITAYKTAFNGLAASMEKKGLSAESGLQGTFRTAAHDLEKLFNEFDSEELIITLLQSRRAEKDLQLRKDAKYVERHGKLAATFKAQVAASRMSDSLKAKLNETFAPYEAAFAALAAEITAGREPSGDQNKAASDTAHNVEKVLSANYIPSIWRNYLFARRHEKDYLLRRDQKYVKSLQESVATIKKGLAASEVPEEAKKTIGAGLDKYQNAFLELVKEDDNIASLTDTMRQSVQAIEPIIEETDKDAGARLAVERDKTNATAAANSATALTIALGTVLFTLIFSILNARALAKPVVLVQEFAARFGQGDLTASLDLQRSDEIGLMASSLSQAIDKIRDIIITVKNAAEQVAMGSEELSQASQQMSQGATEQAASVEETSSSMEEMTGNIQGNTDNAQQTEKIADQASRDALETGQAVNETVSAMKEIAGKIGIIEEIARQTNLLALNAAIEAARAGEHGKGFAVVAAEVRKLAERSQTAAGEITKLASSSTRVAETAGQRLNKLVPDIQKTADLIREIAAASREQNTGADQINRAIQELDRVIQKNAGASEEMAATAEELSSQSVTLKGAVSFFSLGKEDHAPAARPVKKKAPPAALVTTAKPAARAALPAPRKPAPARGGGALLDMRDSGGKPDKLDDEFTQF